MNELARQDFDDDFDGDPVESTGGNGAGEAPKTSDLTLEVALEVWPDEPVAAADTPLDQARSVLINRPGQAYRLAGEFSDLKQALRVASNFADASPDEFSPDADGVFSARPFQDGNGRWRVAVRYDAAPPDTVFPDFSAWVEEWLVPVIHRPLKSGAAWCPQWWRHAEAVARLHSLWQAWESSRAEGESAMSYWWTMHFDPHFATLTDGVHGPFAACKEQVHDPTKPAMLPSEPSPADWDWPGGQILGV